jgi:uncharacterized membrane protein
MENQERFQNQQFGGFIPPPQPLPNATPVLVLGIASIILCCCYGAPGLVCAIVAIILAKKDLRLYNANPSLYLPGSYNNLKAGRICAIVGLAISILYLLFVIIAIAVVGVHALTDPEALKEFMRNH